MRHLPIIFIISVCTFVGCVHKATPRQMETCESSQALQAAKSAELMKIEQEDQADRSGPYDSINWDFVNPRDLQRRINVAGIFAEGCFKTAADYKHAALVFQHGTTADHYYQAFLWANQAVKKGDVTQRSLMGAGLDRYLVMMGQKQLFGTQFSKDPRGKFCLQAVEPSFPESRRVEIITMNLKDNTAFVLKAIGSTQTPEEIKICDRGLKPSPKGTVPGFW